MTLTLLFAEVTSRTLQADHACSHSALKASKRVPPAAQCVPPVMPVDAVSMSNKAAVNVEQQTLTGSDNARRAASGTCLLALSGTFALAAHFDIKIGSAGVAGILVTSARPSLVTPGLGTSTAGSSSNKGQ